MVNYRPIARLRALALLLLTGMGVGACGDGGGESSQACGPDVTESLDPRSAQHLLPGAAEPAYGSDPPTSGAHELGTNPRGVVTTPLRRPVQVLVLEEGGVVVQYRALADADRRLVESLADDEVVVAPNPGLNASVVATAWRHRMTCQRVDPDALAGFIEAHRGRGADG